MELLQVLTLNLCGFDPGLEAGSRLAIKSNLIIYLVPYFKYRLLMFYSTVSDSYLIIRNPIFTDNYGNTKEKINFSECINHFKSARLAFLQYQKRRGQNVYK